MRAVRLKSCGCRRVAKKRSLRGKPAGKTQRERASCLVKLQVYKNNADQYVVEDGEGLGFAEYDQRKNLESQHSQRNGLMKSIARIIRSNIPLRLDW
jgi:hypothetical protein